jgi:hypothetical protein
MLAASACQADLLTTVTVTSSRESLVAVSLTFDEEATAALTPELDTQLTQLVSSRLGVDPSRGREGSKLTLSASVPYDVLVANSALLGVQSLQQSPPASGDGTALTAVLVTPTDLIEAISTGVASQPDADALKAAMLGSTSVGLRVVFPGRVLDVRFVDEQGDARPLDLARGVHDVVLAQPLSEFRPGTLQVTGEPVASSSSPWRRTLLVTGAVCLLAVAAWLASKRVSPRPSTRPPSRPLRRPH